MLSQCSQRVADLYVTTEFRVVAFELLYWTCGRFLDELASLEYILW